MAGKFARYATTGSAETVYLAWNFIQNSGQTTVRFVEISGSGTTFYKTGVGATASISSGADAPTGSYFVIEPVAAYPGTGRWQLRISNSTSANTNKAAFSIDGGWTNTSASAGGTFPVSGTTADTAWNDAGAPAANSYLYCGTNTFTYLSSSTYLTGTYAWFAIQDGVSQMDQMVFAGGYVPFDMVADTKPGIFLARKPTLALTAEGFGYRTANANCLNRVAPEYAHSSALTSSGYAFVAGTFLAEAMTSCKTYTSIYPALPLYVFATAGNCLGYMAENSMLQIDSAKTNLDTNVAQTYIVFDDIFVYYNTAL